MVGVSFLFHRNRTGGDSSSEFKWHLNEHQPLTVEWVLQVPFIAVTWVLLGKWQGWILRRKSGRQAGGFLWWPRFISSQGIPCSEPLEAWPLSTSLLRPLMSSWVQPMGSSAGAENEDSASFGWPPAELQLEQLIFSSKGYSSCQLP